MAPWTRPVFDVLREYFNSKEIEGMIAEGVQKLAMLSNKKMDPSVGVSEIKKVGTQVKQGEPLMMIHYNDETKMEEALEFLKSAYRLAPKRPNPPDLIAERVA